MLTKRTDISSIRGYAPNYSVNLISKSDRLLATGSFNGLHAGLHAKSEFLAFIQAFTQKANS
jgi:hypothetical protein